MMITRYLRFGDLKARGIVGTRTTLSRWIRDNHFPAGVLLGPNTVAWPEDEIEAWERERRAERARPAQSA